MTKEKALDIVKEAVNKLGDKISSLENKNKTLEIENKRLETIYHTRCSKQLLCERNDWYSYFTVGKKYRFIGEDEKTYVVIDNRKKFQVLPKYYFKEIT